MMAVYSTSAIQLGSVHNLFTYMNSFVIELGQCSDVGDLTVSTEKFISSTNSATLACNSSLLFTVHTSASLGSMTLK